MFTGGCWFICDLIYSTLVQVPSGGGAVAAAPTSGGGAAPAAAETKEEVKEEKVCTLISVQGSLSDPFAGRVRRRYGLWSVRLGYSCTDVMSPSRAPRFSDARWSVL